MNDQKPEQANSAADAQSSLNVGFDIVLLAKIACYQYWLGYYTGKNMTTPDAEARAKLHLGDETFPTIATHGYTSGWVQDVAGILDVVSNV